MSNDVEKMSKNVTETWTKLFQNLENNLTLIRATVDVLKIRWIDRYIVGPWSKSPLLGPYIKD